MIQFKKLFMKVLLLTEMAAFAHMYFFGANGIAVLQSTVSKKQAYFFRNKKPILLPDRKGSNFLEIAKKYNWNICIPNWNEKDANEVIQKYGKLVLAQKIKDGVQDSIHKAELLYKLWTRQ